MQKRICWLLGGWLLAHGIPADAAQAQAETKAQTSAQTEKKAGAASASSAANASAQAGKSLRLEGDTAFEAELTKPLDVKKNKAGDVVEARARNDVKSGGEVVIPKGSKLFGHVTDAQARAKGQEESRLGLVFDRAVTKEGREIPLNVAVQAVAASEAALSMARNSSEQTMTMPAPRASSPTARAGGGSLVGGVTSTAGATVSGATGAAGSLGATAGGTLNSAANAGGGTRGLLASGALANDASGAIGLRGLNLTSDASSVGSGAVSSRGCVLTSTTQNVRLESGTRFLLKTKQHE